MSQSLGKLLITAGIVLVLVGAVIYFRDSIPFLKNPGGLPGDISVKRENFSFYFPVTTCIVISVVVSLILYLLNRFR